MINSSSQSKWIIKSVTLGLAIGAGLALVFLAGFLLRDFIQPHPMMLNALGQTEENPGYPLVDEVQNLLDLYYVHEQSSYHERQYGAVRGLLQTLNDPYTFFIDPPVAASESDVLAGTYGGIGVQLRRSDQNQILLYPFSESPAELVGIEDDDILIAINGTAVDLSMTNDQLDQLLRGEVTSGNGVEVTVQKASTEEEQTLFIEFAVINVPSVTWHVMTDDTRIGYIQVMRFTARTPEELRTGLNALYAQDVDGIILDLRNNTGGLLLESIQVADEFLASGVIVYEQFVNGEIIREANAEGLATTIPMVTLINNRTASGSEIVAGALQDLERSILIGQQSYGKGTVQQIFPLSDQSSLHVTSSAWFTPNRQPLDQVGLTPDIEMIPDAAGRDVELAEALRQVQLLLETESVSS